MDQRIIESTKWHYRTGFMQSIVTNDDGQSVKEFWKCYNIKYTVFNVTEAWQAVTEETLKKGWNKLWYGAKEEETTTGNILENAKDIRILELKKFLVVNQFPWKK